MAMPIAVIAHAAAVIAAVMAVAHAVVTIAHAIVTVTHAATLIALLHVALIARALVVLGRGGAGGENAERGGASEKFLHGFYFSRRENASVRVALDEAL